MLTNPVVVRISIMNVSFGSVRKNALSTVMTTGKAMSMKVIDALGDVNSWVVKTFGTISKYSK